MKRAWTMGLAALTLAATAQMSGDKDKMGSDAMMGSYAFEVRVENVSTPTTLKTMKCGVAVPLAPGVWAVHEGANPLFTPGEAAGLGLERLAEDGDPAALAAELAMKPGVASAGVFAVPAGKDGPAPIFPGEAYTFRITAAPGARLSLATMFVQSNDWFYAPGPEGIELFPMNHPLEGEVTMYFKLWDAGTEVNEPAGEGPNQAPRQMGKNYGADEGGVVHDVMGVELTGPVIKVTVAPVK
ncbi:spondin domain-containing protein [Oceanithermus profundus]